MREVNHDDHWADERADNDRRRDEYAASDAINESDLHSEYLKLKAEYEKLKARESARVMSDGPAELLDAVAVLDTTAPSETELVIVSLLMRLYDIQMALLSNVDKPLADSIYDTHNNGGHFNPEIFIPGPVEEEDDEGS